MESHDTARPVNGSASFRDTNAAGIHNLRSPAIHTIWSSPRFLGLLDIQCHTRSEAKEITRLNEELAAIVQITRAARKDRLIGSAVAGSRESGAELMIVVLQIVIIADVNDSARMRQPCQKRLRLHLLCASQGGLGRVDERRVVFGNETSGPRPRKLIVQLGAEDLRLVDELPVLRRVIAVEKVCVVVGQLP